MSSKSSKSTKSTKKSIVSDTSAATMERVQEVQEACQATVDGFKPHQKSGHAGFAPRVMGFLGYGKDTGTEVLALALTAETGVTKPELIQAYCDATGKTEKQAKSSLSVFLSDSQRAFGRYYASRSLVLLSNGDRFKFSPDSIEAAQVAIAAGALTDLKAIPERERVETNAKFTVFLKKHSLGSTPTSAE